MTNYKIQMTNEFNKQQSKTIGVLAIQGSVDEHINALESMCVTAFRVKSKGVLDMVDALILPGGESTTISKLLDRFDLRDEFIRQVKKGKPIYGTCAGMILLSQNINYSMKLMDIDVDRNAYGRQLDSFMTELEDIDKKKLEVDNLSACFIRAPKITRVGGEVEVLARYENESVLVREKNMLVSSFHPELTDDRKVYEYFLKMV